LDPLEGLTVSDSSSWQAARYPQGGCHTVSTIGRAIRYLRDQAGIAVLLVEQYLDFCRELADEVNIMERGQIVHTGPASDLDKPEVRKLLTV